MKIAVSSLLMWGIFSRLFALVYLIFFLSLRPQIAGLDRIYPIDALLRRVADDHTGLRRYLYFPTLSWVWGGAKGLEAFASLGALFSLLAIVGGSFSWLFLMLAWVMALSLINSMGEFVSFVWDRLLLEAGFLVIFLPSVCLLPSLEMVTEPHTLIRWALCFLLFRVMFGMGKYKFLGRWTQQMLYIKWFFSFQPLPARCAYYAFRLPDFVHKLSLCFMFVAEMIVPFALLAPGKLAVAAGVCTAVLQIGIWLSGNFGIFNLLTMVLCIPAMTAAHGTGSSLPFEFVLPFLLIAMLGGLIYLPYNTWVTGIWLYAKGYKAPVWTALKWVADFYRWLHPFHIANAYGIFETEEKHDADLPGLEYRRVLVIEGSYDKKEWREYTYRFQTCHPTRPPEHFAPHQPRIDHNLYYEAFNVRFSNINMQNPYYCGRFTWLDRLVQRLLEGDSDVLSLFAGNPFPESPPNYIRIKRYNVRFTTAHEKADTGHWYVREFYEMKLEPVSLNSRIWELPRVGDFARHHTWWLEQNGQKKIGGEQLHWEDIIEQRPPSRMNFGGKHLIAEDGYWVDATFTDEMPLHAIVHSSAAHEKVKDRFPELKAFSHIPKAVLVCGGCALKIGPEGKRVLTRSGLKKMFG